MELVDEHGGGDAVEQVVRCQLEPSGDLVGVRAVSADLDERRQVGPQRRGREVRRRDVWVIERPCVVRAQREASHEEVFDRRQRRREPPDLLFGIGAFHMPLKVEVVPNARMRLGRIRGERRGEDSASSG